MRVLFALLSLAATVSAQGLTGPNFYVTSGDFKDYTFSVNGADVKDPALTLTVGTTYKFILNTSMSIHPFGFSLDNDTTTIRMDNLSNATLGGVTSSGSCTAAPPADGGPNAWYTTDVANPCIISITPPLQGAVGTPLYYRCSKHAAMVGSLTAVAAAGGSGTGTTAGTGTGTGTGTTSGTGTPGTGTGTGTTPSGTGTGTGTGTGGKNNGAAVIVPGATALIIAAINALFNA